MVMGLAIVAVVQVQSIANEGGGASIRTIWCCINEGGEEVLEANSNGVVDVDLND